MVNKTYIQEGCSFCGKSWCECKPMSVLVHIDDRPCYLDNNIKAEKLDRITDLIRSWIDKQGHDSCWYYPDIFKQICDEVGIEWVKPKLPPRSEFEKGCFCFQQELYGLRDETCITVGNTKIPIQAM